MANCLINFGLQDLSNEQNDYINTYYSPVNPAMVPALPGIQNIYFPNRWQPLSFDFFVDQSGNPIPFNIPPFLSPEWGRVEPFALSPEDRTILNRNGNDWWTYHDPGPPPEINLVTNGGLSDEYKWGFCLVALWSAHLDPADTTKVDISPASFGNYDISNYPTSFPEYRTFYDSINGGDPGTGRNINPVTNLPYVPQIVKRADYARVLAEFWADGPDSETPPGHWFGILNYVNDHPLLEKKYQGNGPILDDLEWDVKSYFMLGGAVHDAAISAWGVKGYYDYLRPISAIRMLCDYGQCTSDTLPNYNPSGVQLLEGHIELVDVNDPLVGSSFQNLNKIKLYAWRGPDYINNPDTDTSGVGWILAENWWPYQRPTFVTPPFAGYVSGHSTFSRAAAEVLTLFTGDEYFPGGMGEFFAPKDDFLVFEKGPSEDITLQWATYRDASDQTSLSRIWGGIHPPADDIPGRLMGYDIGHDAFALADAYFNGQSYIYVDSLATGLANGVDWQNAFTTLTQALEVARKLHVVEEIRIAKGTYFPSDSARSNAFDLVDGVKIIGGFTANDMIPDERDIALNPTILSGDIGSPSIADNVYHVIRINELNDHMYLDGLTIEGGNANGPTVDDRKGGGIFNKGQIHLVNITIANCFATTANTASIFNVGDEGFMTIENMTIIE